MQFNFLASDKMKKFLNKIPAKVIIKEEKKAKPIQNLLNEAVAVKSNDKEMIYHYIEHPCNAQYTLATYSDTYEDVDRTIVFSRKSGNMVLVVLFEELEEISDFIVELCDQMGWPFTSGVQEDTSRIIFEIFVR